LIGRVERDEPSLGDPALVSGIKRYGSRGTSGNVCYSFRTGRPRSAWCRTSTTAMWPPPWAQRATATDSTRCTSNFRRSAGGFRLHWVIRERQRRTVEIVTSGHSVIDHAGDRFTTKTGYSQWMATGPVWRTGFACGEVALPTRCCRSYRQGASPKAAVG